MSKALEDYTLDELSAMNEGLTAERAGLKSRQMAIQKVMDRKAAEKEVADRMGVDPSKVSITIAPDGIESEEAAGEPEGGQ